MNRSRNATRAPAQRSAVTNGSAILVGVNGRSALARRYRDLVETLGAEIGDQLSEVERLQIRGIASAVLHAEEMTAGMIRGEPVDAEAITRATNGATRALAALRRRKAARQPHHDPVEAHLAAKRAGART